jgi:hypothetical protein
MATLHLPTLKDQKADFTSEGAPPAGVVGTAEPPQKPVRETAVPPAVNPAGANAQTKEDPAQSKALEREQDA